MGARNAYLALGYACNEKCRCCPLVNKYDREHLIPMNRLMQEADRMCEYGVTDVTLSGGEPTLHSGLFQIISYFHQKNIKVHILSNGERFHDQAFGDAFLALANGGELTVTTTFHSWKSDEHEHQNATPGSFRRSLEGLRYLDEHGLRISVKQCITANNYRQLPEDIQFVMDSFSDRVEIQLWGIDLNGLSYEQANENFVDFREVRPYIQEAVDVFERSGRAEYQMLTINNLPLCMCDCYYWRYFTAPEEDSYIDHNKEGCTLEANSGPISAHCSECPFRSTCTGAYFSDFDLLGDDIVAVPELEAMADNYQNHYLYYTPENVGKMFFSPYLFHRLGRDGYVMNNYLANSEMILRMRTEQILQFQKRLTDGISLEDLQVYLDGFGMDGTAITGELMRKGIVE